MRNARGSEAATRHAGSQPDKNPTWTILALAWRTSDYILEQKRLGRLVRSHLGIAGDCAVASIEDREFDPALLDLDVVPEQLGEPELGDTVVREVVSPSRLSFDRISPDAR